MVGVGPSILVIDDGGQERRCAVAALLRQAGFTPIAAADADAATAQLECNRFAAAVIALSGRGGIDLAARMRRQQVDLRALIVIEPSAMTLDELDSGDALVRSPFEPRELLGCLFELVLRPHRRENAVHLRDAAGYGVPVAKLACQRR
jgi:DNA-binding response OmpR family regulator